MTATFVPCGAKLPVIALMGGVMAGYMSGDMDLATMMAPIMYFCRYRCGSCIRYHVKEDKTVLRKTGSVRYGASGLPHSVR